MQKPRSPPIASTRAQIGGKMAKMPIWHRWVASAADYLLRQIGQIGRVCDRTRARARVA